MKLVWTRSRCSDQDIHVGNLSIVRACETRAEEANSHEQPASSDPSTMDDETRGGEIASAPMAQAQAFPGRSRTGLGIESASEPPRGILGMTGDESTDLPASREAVPACLSHLSRRALFLRVLLAAPALYASRSLAREQPAPSDHLVKATVTNPQLWKPEWTVGEALVGQFTVTNSDPLNHQDGSVKFILYDSDNQIENTALIAAYVPAKARLDISFITGPSAKGAGAKTLELQSGLNSLKINLTARPAFGGTAAPVKTDAPSGAASKDEHCWRITTVLGMCR
jgi:hypothetical protein